jgi:hypothetical protein
LIKVYVCVLDIEKEDRPSFQNMFMYDKQLDRIKGLSATAFNFTLAPRHSAAINKDVLGPRGDRSVKRLGQDFGCTKY